MRAQGNGSAVRNGKAPPRTVTIYPSRRTIEVEPNVRVAQLPREHVPEIAICKLRPVGDGTYQPVAVIYEATIRLTEAAKVLRVPYNTLRRLCRAGFIESAQIAPNNVQVNLSSWFAHVGIVRNDPEFWSRKENMRKYREAL